MCDEVIFRGRYLHTVEDLQIALEGGEIVSNHQCGYTEDDLLPHCCLCPVDLAQTAAKNGMRLWPSSEGKGVWVLSDEDSQPEQGVMNMINDGGPAFPVWELNGKDQPEMTGFGMSLRDYFAAKAMQGLAANPKAWDMTDEMVAVWAYNAADAMLKAREASND